MERQEVRWSKILWYNLLFLLLLIALMEWVSSRYVDKPSPSLVTDYRLNHVWPANDTSVHHEWIPYNPDFPEPYVHYYNQQGWLEKYDVSRQKPAGTYRIFYVGDSFTEGTVPMDQSVPSLVEQKLNQLKADPSLKIEVINTGVSSYSPTLYYILVRYKLLEYDPDLVVVNIDMTDEFDDWKYAMTTLYDEEGNPRAVPMRNLESSFIDTEDGAKKITGWHKAGFFLTKHSYTYNLLIQKVLPRLRSGVAPAGEDPPKADEILYQRWSWCKAEWDELTQKNVNYTLDMLRRLAKLCQTAGIKLMYTSVPQYKQYAGNEDGEGPPEWSSRPHYVIQQLSKEQDVPYLNAFEAMKPSIEGTPHGQYYYNRDIHFNPRGYALWAQQHIRFLTDPDNQLLPETFFD